MDKLLYARGVGLIHCLRGLGLQGLGWTVNVGKAACLGVCMPWLLGRASVNVDLWIFLACELGELGGESRFIPPFYPYSSPILPSNYPTPNSPTIPLNPSPLPTHPIAHPPPIPSFP